MSNQRATSSAIGGPELAPCIAAYEMISTEVDA
jgi:hypothetical protein